MFNTYLVISLCCFDCKQLHKIENYKSCDLDLLMKRFDKDYDYIVFKIENNRLYKLGDFYYDVSKEKFVAYDYQGFDV